MSNSDKKRERSTLVECPTCQDRTISEVTKTSEGRFGTIRRRRRCTVCGDRFTTIESNRALPYYQWKEGLNMYQNEEEPEFDVSQ